MNAFIVYMRRNWRILIAAVLVPAAGFISLTPLRSLSLDALFALRGAIPPNHRGFPRDVVICFMGESAPGDWTPFTRLLGALKTAEAKAVVFDFAFTHPAWNENASANASVRDFTNAISSVIAHGDFKVVFASIAQNSGSFDLPRYHDCLPGILAELAARFPSDVGIGMADLQADTTETMVRSYHREGRFGRETLAYAVLSLLGQSRGPENFFLNFYGPPGALVHMSYKSDAVQTNALDLDVRGKVVFVGQGPATARRANSSDRYNTPFALSEEMTSTGVEIQATAFANLGRDPDECIRDLLGIGEGILILLAGALLGVVFVQCAPARAFWAAVASGVLVSVFSFLCFKYLNRFLPWLSIGGAQMGAGFLMSFLPVKSAFISYRRGDKAVVILIANGLTARGVELYFDHNRDDVGNLEETLLEEVDKRNAFILIVTPKVLSLAKSNRKDRRCDWVGEELARAVHQQKLVLPVFVEDVGQEVSQRRKDRTLPVYEAIHTKECVKMEIALTGKFQGEFTLAHLESSTNKIACMLPWGLRRDWGKKLFVGPWQKQTHG